MNYFLISFKIDDMPYLRLVKSSTYGFAVYDLKDQFYGKELTEITNLTIPYNTI